MTENRTIPGYSNPFETARLRFQSIGVGLTDASFQTLALEGNQYMVVGEEVHGTETNNTSVYSLLVDGAGLAVKTTLENWDRMSPNHALYIDGNIYVTGNVISRDGQLLDGMPNPQASSNLTYWKSSVALEPSRIFHNGAVTVGPRTTSAAALYGLTVARPSNYRLSEIQLALQNQKNATGHVGFVGNASNSPFVIATTSNTPIEFHTGRGFGYFEKMYRPGDTSRDIPIYTDPTDAPMLAMDQNGSVVIGWNEAPRFLYEKRMVQASRVRYDTLIERAKLHVSGMMYASNVVIHDPDTNTPKSLDSLFIRKETATYLANRIFPGAFANGTYTFPDTLRIGNELTTSNFSASNAFIQTLKADTLDVTGTSKFRNQMEADTSVLVRENIYLQGGLFVESTDANGAIVWSPIEFTSSNLNNRSNTNIVSYQDGFYTTGRVGVGVNEGRGLGINQQLVVARSSPTVMGIELRDETSTVRTYQGYMGHVDWRDNFVDGSLIFMTAPVSQVGQDRYLQNIYMMPGKHKQNTNDYLQSETIPTLAVLQSDQVVINGYTPAASNASLSVEGDTYVNGEIYLRDDDIYFSLAKWREVSIFNLPQKGLEYKNPEVSSIGIHTDPNPVYAMNVAGKVYLPDGLFDFSQNETSQWYNTTSGSIEYMPPEGEIRKMFTQSRVGVGVVDPQTTLEMKSWDISVPTQLTLNQASGELSTGILFRGADPSVNAPNFAIEALPVPPGTALGTQQPVLTMRNSSAPAASNPGFSMIWDPALQKHRVSINESSRIHGSNLFPGSTNATMTVGGGLNVIGDVHTTGNYLMSGTVVINCNLGLSNNAPSLGQDNVYIYGNQIQLNPTTNLSVGYTQALFDADTTGAVFRVYHPNPTGGVVARFLSQSTSALVEIASQPTGKRFRLGLDTDDNFIIASTDTATPYFYVKKGGPTPGPIAQRTLRGTGYGTNNPEAFVHIVNDIINEPTLRITRSISSEQPGAEPYVDLERRVTNANNSYIWRLRGPDSTYQDRLTLEYITVDTLGNKTLGHNAFAVTRTGDMGLGTDTPTARLHLVSHDTPGLLLQTDNAALQPHLRMVASNVSTEYNLGVEENGSLYLHSLGTENIANQRRNLLEFSSNGKVGLRDIATDAYTLNMSKDMNINGGGVFIDGVSMLQGSNLGRLYDQKFYHKNLYMLPDPEFGSITINRPDRTSNWFHIRGRNDDPTVLVLESTRPESWIYQQATTTGTEFHMHRMGISNLDTISHDFLPQQPTVDVRQDAPYLRFSAAKYLGSNDNRLFTQHFYSDTYIETPSGSNSLHLGPNTSIVGLHTTLEVTAYNGVGIGVAPDALLHIGTIFANSNLPGLRIDQPHGADALIINDRDGSNVITANSNVGIHIRDPLHPLHVNGTAFIEKDTYLASDLYVKGDAHTTSDARLKTNLTPIQDPLEKLQELTGYLYDRIDLGGKASTGLLAQDVQRVLPEAVHTNTDTGYLSIAYGNLMGLMVESIKSLKKEVEDLRKKVDSK